MANGIFLLAIKEGCEYIQNYPWEFLKPVETVPRTQLSLSHTEVHSAHSNKAKGESLMLNGHMQAGKYISNLEGHIYIPC